MNFKPIRKLSVNRKLTNGQTVFAGTLAQNHTAVYFQYDQIYLDRYGNLSPFLLKGDTSLQVAPKLPHFGLHGVYADSLPDDWGLSLQDRFFRQCGILPTQVTAMDRLAFVGEHAIGALSFLPQSQYQPNQLDTYNLATLGLSAQSLFDSQFSRNLASENDLVDILGMLVNVGTSGGARPKAQIYLRPEDLEHSIPKMRSTQNRVYRVIPQKDDEAWIIKFTSQNLPLGHEEGLCEGVYLQLADIAKCRPQTWSLIEAPEKSGALAWLAVKRFDCTNQNNGRFHLHSACGLLDADYRSPSLDYEDLIKLSRQLCQSVEAGKLQFRRAMFNLFASNQDDHSKNWSFLQDDNGNWHVAPFFDVTFSPHPFNQHATAFCGYGNTPSLKSIQQLAAVAGIESWNDARMIITEVVEVLSDFAKVAKSLDVKANTIRLIQNILDIRRRENIALLK
ncbi:type II toxin-antitoxin system HipA family toxin [Thorsellia anophelis]|uniref:Serine/threonine-protein kinase HipA n=1 Tax=Thorsellia anophelis DSM 18579 TaxID=1123402 RepID=A0A1I0AQK3_9GAMM|nr:type II toxin-antitoxin system HipA family toxin [Thorsellia anophelis]SES96702.1 serine/threonine-protein kinase HipA [Thorsellia anophelis DSM 18579]